MTRGEPRRQEDSGCKILQFQPRATNGHRKGAVKNAERDIGQLLDLSRYEDPGRNTDEFRARMVENAAAVVLLSVLVAFAAFDVISLEQIQHCASAGSC